jgi:hypothetical protein
VIAAISRVARQRGFALVITVTLLALLVLMVVALSSMVKADTALAETARQQAAARQNALLAVDVAVARLQQFAGPDARVTATGDYLAGAAQPHLAGVWDGEPGPQPLTWLVSGNDGASPLAISPASVLRSAVTLVGPGTVGAAEANDQVAAPLVDLMAPDVPGQIGDAVVGRCAWWVCDQGVKASLALPDRSRELNYAPYDRPEMLLRLRCQIPRGPAAFATNPPAGFDPEAIANAPLLGGLIAPGQIPQLAPVGSASLADFMKANFHQFTSVHWGVLANTRTDATRGLKLDLSLDPELLGPAFTAYASYVDYMEPTADGGAVTPPIRSDDSLRRRYRLRAAVVNPAPSDPPLVFSVSPVLTEFMLQFSIQRSGPTVQVKSRLYAGLWNPYTSALVPEALRLEIGGLPVVLVQDGNGAGSQSIDLQSVFGASSGPPYAVNLPFASSGTNDTISWLPGRLYSWTTQTGSAPAADLHFYDKNITASGWLALTAIPGTAHLSASASAATHLTVRLTRADNTVLATCTSPALPAFVVPDTMAAAQDGWNFGFGFRLNQVSAQTTDRSWLLAAGGDPRATGPGAPGLMAFDLAKGLDPAQYFGTTTTATGQDHFLLFRSMGGTSNVSVSANNDAPLFELPRQPVLNPAELQHLQVAGARPFALGNPWAPPAGSVNSNAVFDRFFFSGLSATARHPDLAAGEPLPNYHLQTVETRANPPAPLALGDLVAAGSQSAGHLLAAGTFNLNSTSVPAWTAVLSALRFADTGWTRAEIDNSSSPTPTLGTQVATVPGVVVESFADAGLDAPGYAVFRFPQSAQETFSAAPLANPNAPTRVPFRRGVRGGDGVAGIPGFAGPQISALASEIVARVRNHLTTSGPFRSLEEFLGASAEFGGRSLLEDAIAAAGLNPAELQPLSPASSTTASGLTSLTITQADLLGILAPFLQTRSDTFLVRAYGESVNPATGRTEARAWCEATVQRLPSPFDPGDSVTQPAGPFGRRFRVVSLRWLAAGDL